MNNMLEKNLEQIEKGRDPKIIEIGSRRIIDVDNEEGALIQSNNVIFVDTNIKKGEEKMYIKKFEDVDGVTSHAYMGCAEIIGELSNGDRFYFHSYTPHSFEKFIKQILSLAEEKDITINNIKIRGEFGRNASIGEDEKTHAESEIKAYKRACRNLGIEEDVVDIEEESITGATREKVVGHSWIKDRD